MTWFCYNPIDGEPCGECPTCVPAYREGMTHRFSAAAVQRYLAFEEREKNLLGNSASKNVVKKPSNKKITLRKIIKYLLPYGFVRFYQMYMKK